MTALILTLTIIAVAVFAAIALTGAWIDGRRQRLRRQGLHPTTLPDGEVVPTESLPPVRPTKP